MADLIKKRRVSVVHWQPETLDFRDRIVANAGTISKASLGYVDAFVAQCKNAGLWGKLVDVGLFVGDQLEAALVKLVYLEGGQGVLTNVGFLAADYHETGVNGGLAGNGAFKYLDTGMVADHGLMSAMAFYNRTAVDNASVRTMLGVGEAANDTLTALRHTLTSDQFAIDGDITQVVRNNSAGFYVGSKLADNDRRLYLNGAQIAASLAAGAFLNEPNNIFVFARNQGGVGAEHWSGKGSFYAICQALTPADNARLYNAVQVLQVSLNRNV